MKMPWYGWVTALAFLTLLLDVYAFAGLRRVPVVGDAVIAQARLESPLMDTYLVAGTYALRYTPFMRGFADGLASSSWRDAYGPIRETPALALHLLRTESSGIVNELMVPVYWAPLLFLPLALVGWSLRPRRISLMRGGQR